MHLDQLADRSARAFSFIVNNLNVWETNLPGVSTTCRTACINRRQSVVASSAMWRTCGQSLLNHAPIRYAPVVVIAVLAVVDRVRIVTSAATEIEHAFEEAHKRLIVVSLPRPARRSRLARTRVPARTELVTSWAAWGTLRVETLLPAAGALLRIEALVATSGLHAALPEALRGAGGAAIAAGAALLVGVVAVGTAVRALTVAALVRVAAVVALVLRRAPAPVLWRASIRVLTARALPVGALVVQAGVSPRASTVVALVMRASAVRRLVS